MFPDHKTLGGRAGRPEDWAGDHLGDRLGGLLLLHMEGGQVDWKGSVLSIKFTFIRLVSTNYILTSTRVHKISSNILSFLDWLIAFFIRLTITATMWSDSAGIDPNTWSLCNLPANLNSPQLWNVVSENHLKDIRLLSKFHLLFFRDIFKTLSLISILSRKIKDYWWFFLDALPFLVSTRGH